MSLIWCDNKITVINTTDKIYIDYTNTAKLSTISNGTCHSISASATVNQVEPVTLTRKNTPSELINLERMESCYHKEFLLELHGASTRRCLAVPRSRFYNQVVGFDRINNRKKILFGS